MNYPSKYKVRKSKHNPFPGALPKKSTLARWFFLGAMLLTLAYFMFRVIDARAEDIPGTIGIVKAPRTAQLETKVSEPVSKPKASPKPVYRPTSEPVGAVEAQIREIAKEEGYQAPNFLVQLAKCESSLNPEAVGDSGKSRGVFQIHKGYHPTITDEQAYSVDWATRWTINKLENGGAGLWTCTDIIS